MTTNRIILLAVCAALLLLHAGTAAATSNSMDDLPMVGRYIISATIGLDQQQFHGVQASHEVTIQNPAQNLSARFNAQGLHLQRNEQQFGLRLRSYGYENGMQPVEHTAPVSTKNRVEFHHGPLTEWYVNGPLGLQQGFTLANPPARTGTDKSPLSLVLAMEGSLQTEVQDKGRTLQLTDASGRTILRYSGLLVYDAAGLEFPATLRTAGNDLIISVNDKGARYPLTIDPIFADAVLSHDDLMIEAPGAHSGMSVAVSGDTVVVGAPDGFSFESSPDYGVVYIFVKPGPSWTDMVQTQRLRRPNPRCSDFGASVAINGDLLIVGDPLYIVTAVIDEGTAFVYYWDGDEWTRGATLQAGDHAAEDKFGTSVAISGDTVVVGAPGHDTRGFNNHGRAYIFTSPAAGWSDMGTFTESAILDDATSGVDNAFGTSVAIDGDTVVVGSPVYMVTGTDAGGMAFIFEKPGSDWTGTVGSLKYLFPDVPGDRATGDGLGTSVAISGDTVLVGAPNHETGGDAGRGAAYIFVKPDTGWELTNSATAKLTTGDSSAGDHFGTSVALSGDTALIGADLHDTAGKSAQGAAYIFTKPVAGWENISSHSAKLTSSNGASGDWLGRSVAIDGLTAVAGAPQHDTQGNTDEGAAYVFTGSGTGWKDMTETAQLRGLRIKNDSFGGDSMAVSGDTLVVGARTHQVTLNKRGQGVAYVFVRPVSGWKDMVQTARLTASNGTADDYSGTSVAVSGDVIIIGAPGHEVGGKTGQGEAYLFVKPADGWTDMTETAKLTASDGDASDFLGHGISVDGETVVIGAIGVNSSQGAAYIFVRPATGWTTMTETAKLTSSPQTTEGFLGWATAIDGNTVVAGAPWPTVGPGAAYVFVRPTAGWTDMTETARLTPGNGADFDEFGDSVSIDGNTIVVGAETNNDERGAAYVFVRPTTGWSDMTETGKLTASDGAATDSLGWSVSISGDTIVAGAFAYNAFQGAAYVFVRPGSGWQNMTETDKLLAGNGTMGDSFGATTIISGQTIFVGSPDKHFVNKADGAVYVYSYDKANISFPWPMFLPAINSNRQ